jgi:hypothetical protein
MLEQADCLADVAASLEPPLGRGMHLQIEVAEIGPLYQQCQVAGAVHRELYDKWYRADDLLLGNHQFWVSDPDGYLLRFFEDLGARPVAR